MSYTFNDSLYKLHLTVIRVKGIVWVLIILACVAGSFAGEGKRKRTRTSSEAASTMGVLAAPPPVRAHLREFALICALAKQNLQLRKVSSVFQVFPILGTPCTFLDDYLLPSI